MPVVASIAPVQSDAQAALKAFLFDLFGSTTTVVAAQANRVAEPASGNFIVMTALSFARQATTNDVTSDVRFVGSIAGNVLTVTSIQIGQIIDGLMIQGTGVAAQTFVQSQTSGAPGGAGTYLLSNVQTLAGPVVFSAGVIQMTVTYFLTIQLDFHSADYTASAWAQTFATAFRDQYAVTFFAGLPSPQNMIVPLYAEDAMQRPFINDQQQFEWRWGVDAKLEIDQVVTVPQTYADSAALSLFEVP